MKRPQLKVCKPVAEADSHGVRCGAGVTAIPPVHTSRRALAKPGNRWGLILAGGDGVRLRPLTQLICGDERPKQFCPLFGARTLLGQTLHRSERTIPREQILVSLSGHHSKWYSQEGALRPSQRIVQPANKGTAPPILHALLSLARLDEQALVAILPCDHHYSNEQAFSSTLGSAFETASRRTDSVVLLGAKPHYPEVEYGWIELGAPISGEGSELFQVRAFQEKPVIEIARSLFEQGSLWSTFVMVGHLKAFLQIAQAALPHLLTMLGSACLWAGKETHIEHSIYQRVPFVSFSHQVLSAETGKLMVLRLGDVGWSDLGDPGRAVMAAHHCGSEQPWIQDWGRTKEMALADSKASAAVA